MVLPRLTDEPLALRVGLFRHGRVEYGCFQEQMEGQLGKDMLGNDLLEVRIKGVRILLEECAYVAVIVGELRQGVMAIGMGRMGNRRCSFSCSLGSSIPLFASYHVPHHGLSLYHTARALHSESAWHRFCQSSRQDLYKEYDPWLHVYASSS